MIVGDTDHRRVDEADREGEGHPAGDGQEQEHLAGLEPGGEGWEEGEGEEERGVDN